LILSSFYIIYFFYHIMKNILRNQKGFTLIEILLVVAAIAILAGIVIVAINPNKQLGDTRNAQRKSDVNTILNAISQYSIDHNGTLPTGITATTTEICATGASSCSGLIDLTVLIPTYLVAVPNEPQGTTANGAGYMVSRTAEGRISVSAQFPEQSMTITATR
jgi:prepilin-type N-terminal cleavage/methylation domain-containing protein